MPARPSCPHQRRGPERTPVLSSPVDVKTLAFLLPSLPFARVLTLESSKESLANARSPRVGVFVTIFFFVLNQNCVWFLFTLLIVLIPEMNTFLPCMKSKHPLWWNLSLLVETEATENQQLEAQENPRWRSPLRVFGSHPLGLDPFHRATPFYSSPLLRCAVSTIQAKWQPVHKGLAWQSRLPCVNF